MYKLLLCWRYLRTRYIALISIISVMLGVATMIVVNSVMEGFSHEMQNRIHGIISDVVVEARNFSGMEDSARHMEIIRQAAGGDIEAMTATVATPAMLSFQTGGQTMSRPVQLIGIDENSQSLVSDFSKYLQHPENRKKMSFDLRENGYDTRDHQAGPDAPVRTQMADAGWGWRRELAKRKKYEENYRRSQSEIQRQSYEEQSPTPATALDDPGAMLPPPADHVPEQSVFSNHPEIAAPATAPFDMAKQQNTGVVLGIATSYYRALKDKDNPNGGCVDRFFVRPGDDVNLTFPTTSVPVKFQSDTFTVVDFYESKMSEYDSSFVFVPLWQLQQIRGMFDPTNGLRMVNSIQIKLKPGADGEAVRDKLKSVFPPELYVVETWRDKQGPLLQAVQMETMILNILLFFIIAVAGFGILAIFYMIVVEKTRDIGILKSLGASGSGVMGIFLSYGLSLGLVGSSVGLIIGLFIVRYINQIADILAWLTNRPVFDPTIYYFYKIPTIVVPQTVIGIVLGAVTIAVLASVLPARRAARLHPVEALRYE